MALTSGLLLVMPAHAVLVLVATSSACSALLIRLGVKANSPLHPEAVDGGRGLRAVFAGTGGRCSCSAGSSRWRR